MKKVAVLLIPGFEEAETIVTTNILCRLQIEVETLTCAESRTVASYHGVPMMTDSTLAARQTDLYDAVVLPGGPQGSINLAVSEAVTQFIARHDDAGKLICPIYSAATRVLGGNGLLKERRYVCLGDPWQDAAGGEYTDAPVVEDSNLISGKGLGHTFDLAFTFSAHLLEDDTPIHDHADHIYYRWQSLCPRMLRYSGTKIRWPMS